ncbi:MAG: hypothetical protein HY590_04320 [Candidatus Omnitrophica bacterium]|nr:hypothetical protein [Candidatus Omnitrophota bacterium]
MKIVIVYASSGAGHQKSAEALFRVAKGRPGLSALLIDSLDYTTPLFHLLYPRAYLFLVRYLPTVWGFFYDGLNFAFIGHILKYLRRFLNAMNGGVLEKFFLSENPDVIVSTHFFASEVASTLKERGRLHARLFTVVTDFSIHSVWVSPLTDGYVVGSKDTEEALIRRGVPKETISILGIPIDPVFEREEDRANLSRQLGIFPEKFTVLVASGGFGVGPIESLVSRLSRDERLQLLVVCGHNRPLYKRLTERTERINHRVKLFGFVHNIHELMSVSDCMVSKSGGLTMSEALVKKLPSFILYPIPGQETGNRDVLVRHRSAITVRNIHDLEKRFEDLDRLQEELAGVRRHIEAFRKIQAAQRVIDHVISKEEKR